MLGVVDHRPVHTATAVAGRMAKLIGPAVDLPFVGKARSRGRHHANGEGPVAGTLPAAVRAVRFAALIEAAVELPWSLGIANLWSDVVEGRDANHQRSGQ